MGMAKKFIPGAKEGWGKDKPERIKAKRIKVKEMKPGKVKAGKIKAGKKPAGNGEGKAHFNFNMLTKASIMGTLLKAFLVPVVLIIILGSVSYITASGTIKEIGRASCRERV